MHLAEKVTLIYDTLSKKHYLERRALENNFRCKTHNHEKSRANLIKKKHAFLDVTLRETTKERNFIHVRDKTRCCSTWRGRLKYNLTYE